MLQELKRYNDNHKQTKSNNESDYEDPDFDTNRGEPSLNKYEQRTTEMSFFM